MKNYINISLNGYPDSKIDSALRAYTFDKKIIEFYPQEDETWAAYYDGKQLQLGDELIFSGDLNEFLNYLKGVRLVLKEDQLMAVPLADQLLAAKTNNLQLQACSTEGCAGHGGCAADGGCGAQGCAGHGGCAADGGCASDGCVAYGGCAARGGCAADGCAVYGACVADAGCAGRGCAADGGCAANVPCVADGCAAHACAADLCPVNVNVGPCAVDIPICPIIL